MGRIKSPATGTQSDTAEGHDALQQLAAQMLQRQLAAHFEPGLYLVATPIGNLADISLRALAVLARADMIYCEDKRHSSRLLNQYGIHVPLRAYHEHNADKEREGLLRQVADGKLVALVSDAGMPLISDPGCKLVREAKARDLPVVVIPGASAPLAALAGAGLPTDEFHFSGFLPPKKQARRKRLQALAGVEATLILFESPRRLPAALADMAELFPERTGAVARELTKLHEEIITAPLSQLAAQFGEQETVKGEIVVLIAPGEKESGALSDEQLRTALRTALSESSLRDAVKTVTGRHQLPRSRVYDMAVALKKELE